MKKFYAIAAAAMMAVSVNAQNGAPLYATGAGDFPGGEWSPENASEFTYSNGNYTLEITNLSKLKISTAKGNWDTFNGGARTCNYGSKQGVAVALTQGSDDIVAPWTGDYTITVAGDLSTLTLTTSTPEPTEKKKIYLRGDMNGWGTDDAWSFTFVKDNIYKFVFADGQSITASQGFKIADAGWASPNLGGNGTAVPAQTDYQVYQNGQSNMNLAETCNGVMWLTLDFGGAAYIWYSNDKDAMPEWAKDNVTPTVSWGLIGEINGWSGDEVMTETESGVYTLTLASISGEFKFRQNSSWTVNYGAKDNADITINGDYAVSQDGANFKIAETKNVTFTLNTNTNVLTVFADSLTGVNEIEDDSIPVKYFNLQGVEVANPVNGLYIKVEGKKTSKVLVK